MGYGLGRSPFLPLASAVASIWVVIPDFSTLRDSFPEKSILGLLRGNFIWTGGGCGRGV